VVVTSNANSWTGNGSSGVNVVVEVGIAAALIGLPLGWLLTAFETGRWLPSHRDPSGGPDRVGHYAARALSACRNAVSCAANDEMGKELRADLRRRAARTDVPLRDEGVPC
jgi:hypothetical protein